MKCSKTEIFLDLLYHYCFITNITINKYRTQGLFNGLYSEKQQVRVERLQCDTFS